MGYSGRRLRLRSWGPFLDSCSVACSQLRSKESYLHRDQPTQAPPAEIHQASRLRHLQNSFRLSDSLPCLLVSIPNTSISIQEKLMILDEYGIPLDIHLECFQRFNRNFRYDLACFLEHGKHLLRQLLHHIVRHHELRTAEFFACSYIKLG